MSGIGKSAELGLDFGACVPNACTQFESHVAVFFASILRFLSRTSLGWSSNQRRLTVSELVVVTYPDEYRAAEVLAALQRLQKELLIDLEDAAYVTKEKDGKMKLHETVPMTRSEQLTVWREVPFGER